MELLICIKQVPDDSVKVLLDTNGEPALDEITRVVNSFDTYALEMAARLKEAHEGSVTVLTIGGEETVPSLRSCLSVGADRAFKLEVTDAGDTHGVGYLLAKASLKISKKPFDLIFCGSESSDTSHSQVGVQLAETLGWPIVTNVLAVEPLEGGFTVKQETEEGYRMLEVPCPCVLTIVKPGYEPRYPSIKSRLAARKIPIVTLGVSDVEADPGQYGSGQAKFHRMSLSEPPSRKGGVKIKEKNAAEAVHRAMEMLSEQKLI